MKRKIKRPVVSYSADIRIVIIEDDDTIRNSYAYLLNNEPNFAIVATYPSFELAEKKLAEDLPDVILLDVQLPGIRGVDCIPTIKKLLPEVHIIILTVYESEEVIFTALRNGASGYLTKNISTEKVIESIKEVMDGGGPMSTGIAKLVMKSFQKNPSSPLTKRETQILQGIAEGKSRNKIAAEHIIDSETVKTHIKNIYQKLNVNSKDEAIRIARDSKYI